MTRENKEKYKRRLWTTKRKLEVILECLEEKETAAEVCHKHGISQSMYYDCLPDLRHSGGEKHIT